MSINFFTLGATKLQPETKVPSCTIHHFPHNIDHTLAWAREQFDLLFVAIPQDLDKHLSDSSYLEQLLSHEPIAGKVQKAQQLLEALNFTNGATMQSCVHEARRMFDQWFNFEIRSLLETHPHDHLDEQGLPFWSPPRRAPSPIEFDAKEDIHVLFVLACARLLAFRSGLNSAEITRNHITESKYSGKYDNIKSTTDDTAEYKRLAELLGIGSKFNNNNANVSKVFDTKFEKDDDSNSHIDFIHSVSTLRAINYGVTPIERLETKKIAGNIIPAMVTTTAAITGLVLIQLFNVVNKKNIVDDYKEGNLDLAQNILAFAEPQECSKVKTNKSFRAIPEEFTVWDKFVIANDDFEKNPTVMHLGIMLKEKYGISLRSISCESTFLYRESDYDIRDRSREKEIKEKKKKHAMTPLVDLYLKRKGKDEVPAHKKHLELSLLCVEIATKKPIEFPTVFFVWKRTKPEKKSAKSAKKKLKEDKK